MATPSAKKDKALSLEEVNGRGVAKSKLIDARHLIDRGNYGGAINELLDAIRALTYAAAAKRGGA